MRFSKQNVASVNNEAVHWPTMTIQLLSKAPLTIWSLELELK